MTEVDIHDPIALRRAGLEALASKLGPVGMVRFLQQVRRGTGDYTKERHTWLDQLDMDTVIREIREQEAFSKPTKG